MGKPLFRDPSILIHYAFPKFKDKQMRVSFQTNFIVATTHN